MEFEIELAGFSIGRDEMVDIERMLPGGYYFRDSTHNGYGTVICTGEGNVAEDIDAAIRLFFESLKSVFDKISGANLLRVAVFTDGVTTTLNLDRKTLQMIVDQNVNVEISVYPTLSEDR
ncbi:MAG: hypothetical protein WD397_16870 [Wenzhouxiangellaceae bacterium]